MSGGANAGWFPDPGGSGLYRWFDGQRWTEHVERGTWPSAVVTDTPAEISSVSFGSERPARGKRGYLIWLAVPAVVVLLAVGILVAVVVRNSDDGTTSGGYPTEVQAAFTAACAADGGAASYCECALAKLEGRIPLTQFQADENTYLTTGAFTADMAQAVQGC